MNDKEHIYELYEEIYKIDFFNESLTVDSFNWDDFFYEAAIINSTSKLIESYELIDSQISEQDKTDIYKIKTVKGKEFNLVLNYQKKSKLNVFVYTGLRAGEFKHSQPTIDYFNKLKDIVGEDGEICFISFKDSQGRTTLTKELGLNSFEVFSSLRYAVLDSFTRNFKNLKGVVMLINKQEQTRRLPFYKKLLTKNLPIYSNIFVDEISDKEYTHLIATI